ELRDLHLVFARESLRGPRRLAFAIVGRRDRGPEDLLEPVLLPLRDTARDDGQPARGDERLEALRGEPFLRRSGLELPRQIRPGAAERGRRHLLRRDLEEEILAVHTAAAGSGSGSGRPAASRRAA